MTTVQEIHNQLKNVLDPELGINIVDLGLLYDVNMSEDGMVSILMTLTTPGCPLSPYFEKEIREQLTRLPKIKKVEITLTFDPIWTQEKMTKEGKNQLALLM